MEFVPIDPSQEPLFRQIKGQIRRLQNWGSIVSLKRLGVDSSSQVGASYVALKDLAKRYGPNLRLAQMLWFSNRREEQMMAEFLLPDGTDATLLEKMLDTCVSNEIAEYFGSIVLANRDDIAEIFPHYLDSGKVFFQIAALTGIARHRLLYKELSKIDFQHFEEILHRNYTDNYVKLVAKRYMTEF